MSAKTEREKIIQSGGPIARHSLNQRHMAYVRDGKEKFSGRDKKAARAKERRKRLMGNLQNLQFNRAVGNTFNGRPLEDIIDLAPENIAYVVKHIDEYERRVETYNTEKGTKVSITIVDFTRPVV